MGNRTAPGQGVTRQLMQVNTAWEYDPVGAGSVPGSGPGSVHRVPDGQKAILETEGLRTF